MALHSGVILLSGLASVTLDEAGEMRLAGAIYPDLLAGAYLALGVQEALAVRAAGGGGCQIEVAMLDVLLTSMAGLISAADRAARFEPHPGQFLRTAEPGRFLAVSDADASAEAFANRTRREAMTALQERGVRAGAVLDIGEVIEDPHLAARDFVIRGDHPLAGPRPMPAVPWLYDGTRPKLRHAPLLGNQTDVVMTEIAHLSSHELASLREQKVLA